MQLLQNVNIDFIGKRNYALMLSVAIILIGLASVLFHQGLNYGIDFAGGTLVQIKFNKNVSVDDLRKAIQDDRLGTPTIQVLGDSAENEFIIKVAKPVEKEVDQTPAVIVTKHIEEAFGKQNFDIRRAESVGPTMGEELKNSAVGSIIGALIMILIYITVRFELRFAIGAIAALVHDVLITVGAFSIADREFNLPVVAALLTIVGYSLNDTIVVFDRIRENQRLLHRKKFTDVINVSINQTLSRTLLTSVTTLLVVLCLFVLGGEVINDFAFALLVGILVGTYSSIFVASPVLVWWSAFMGMFQSKSGK